ncbi:hypothetical protein [Orenia marismortui]|uniref:Uncharacterized protein n=1 Tax=Orenia marismortui TaxID=46469 RepID=A0A4R8GDV9_9FIRM|nr:hypothetical protein [Orenia marismortui]TDX42298.1 hypothetical protein C7959_1852 [Orenia marismortui]
MNDVVEVVINFIVLIICLGILEELGTKKGSVLAGFLISIFITFRKLIGEMMYTGINIFEAMGKIDICNLILLILFYISTFWLAKKDPKSYVVVLMFLFFWAISPLK